MPIIVTAHDNLVSQISHHSNRETTLIGPFMFDNESSLINDAQQGSDSCVWLTFPHPVQEAW